MTEMMRMALTLLTPTAPGRWKTLTPSEAARPLALSDVDIRKNPLEGCVAADDFGGAAAAADPKNSGDESYSDRHRS
jgi:hypothetical protein